MSEKSVEEIAQDIAGLIFITNNEERHHEIYQAVREALTKEREARLEAERKYQFMVNKVADEKLDGYRELGAKCAELENKNDELQKKLAEAENVIYLYSNSVGCRCSSIKCACLESNPIVKEIVDAKENS